MIRKALVLGLMLLGDGRVLSETVKDREGAVREDAVRMETNDRWIYNDVAAGFAEARKTGKPLMVVLRCVPCLSCLGLDAAVLMEKGELRPLMDRFVLVRVMNANSLDLSKFQFDYDLSLSVLFFRGDGTIYGRFGSWEHQRDGDMRTTDGLRQAMEAVLKLHAGGEALDPLLKGKTGPKPQHATPVEMPVLKGRYRSELDWNGQVVKSCVHCHQVGDAQRLELREAGKALPVRMVYPYPAPEVLGLEMKPEAVRVIGKVRGDSPAAAAGLQPGDRIVSFGGQAPVSIADLSWVLHWAPETGSLAVQVDRSGERIARVITLADGWRRRADISRRVGTWPMRAMAFGGMKLEELDDPERRRLGIGEGELALRAAHVGQHGKHAAAKREGFRKGDVLVEVDGSSAWMTEGQLLGRHMLERRPGDKVPAVVLRNGRRVPLTIPVQ